MTHETTRTRRILVAAITTAIAVGASGRKTLAQTTVVHVSKLCADPTGVADGTRALPFPTIERAVEALNDAANTKEHARIVLLPTAPGDPYGPATLDVPGKELTVVSESGPGLTACRELTLAGGTSNLRREVTIEGLFFATPGSTAITGGGYDDIRVQNCIFVGCRTGVDLQAAGYSRLECVNSVFHANDYALAGTWGSTPEERYVFVNCTFTEQAANVQSLPTANGGNQQGGLYETFTFCAFCGNTAFTHFRATVTHTVSCPEGSDIFVAPGTRNFQLAPASGFRNAGAPWILNPDGTRSDLGAFGGPGALPYWSELAGTRGEIASVRVEPEPDGASVKVKVWVK